LENRIRVVRPNGIKKKNKKGRAERGREITPGKGDASNKKTRVVRDIAGRGVGCIGEDNPTISCNTPFPHCGLKNK